MKNRVRAILGGTSAAAIIGAGFLLATPAQAAIPADGTVPDGVGFIQTKSAVDAGGVKYTISVDWNYKYEYQGNTRVSVNPLTVYRSDANVITTGSPEDAGLDLHFDVSSNGISRWTQHKVYDAVDLDAGADNQASFNPANPISNADDTFIRVKVGTDGDGFGSSAWVYFVQPEGIGPKPAA